MMVWNLEKRGNLGVKRVKEGGDAGHRQFTPHLSVGCRRDADSANSKAGKVPLVLNLDKRGDLGVKRVKEGGDAGHRQFTPHLSVGFPQGQDASTSKVDQAPLELNLNKRKKHGVQRGWRYGTNHLDFGFAEIEIANCDL